MVNYSVEMKLIKISCPFKNHGEKECRASARQSRKIIGESTNISFGIGVKNHNDAMTKFVKIVRTI